ncbi:DUF6069 family protein [Kineococcus aurantiacus]|uniref:Uncharacterized protein n=1 Tax=Kineococcus aurantiacus TaxID=37633 RepID=A0A7Y9DQF6_9ACTN|nr:hypothetical protein [Kineococcus aurantiacus]
MARGPRGTIARGAVAGPAAAVVVTAVAAVARAGGVRFEVPDGGAGIPLVGFAVVTLVAAGAGVVVALVLRRWAARPARTFVGTSAVLTALSLPAPWSVDADAVTAAVLSALHLVAAAVVVPLIASSLPRSR